MKLRIKLSIFSLVLILILGCSEEDSPVDTTEDQIELTEFNSISFEEINTNSASIIIEIVDNGGSEIKEKGVCWSIDQNPTIIHNSIPFGEGSDNFNVAINDLESNTVYNVRAYAKNDAGISYSDNGQFKTLEESNSDYSGVILKTIDGGSTWQSIKVDNILNLHSVFFSDENTGYAVGDLGKIIKTEDAGENWSIQNSGNYILNDVFFINNDEGYAVGNHSKILRTEDGGTNWFEVQSGTNKELRSIYFTDDNTGYIVGNQGIILKSENAGNTWSNVAEDPYRKSLHSIKFVDSNKGYAVGFQKIYKTIDSGLNWETDLNIGYQVNDISLVSEGPIFAVSQQGIVLKLDSSTNEWNRIAEYLTYDLKTVFFTNSNVGYVAGFNGDIFKTTDGGQSWNPQESGTTYLIESMHFTDDNKGIAVGFMK